MFVIFWLSNLMTDDMEPGRTRTKLSWCANRKPIDSVMHCYDMESGAWLDLNVKGTPSTPRVAASAAAVGDKVYYFGGRSGAPLPPPPDRRLSLKSCMSQFGQCMVVKGLHRLQPAPRWSRLRAFAHWLFLHSLCLASSAAARWASKYTLGAAQVSPLITLIGASFIYLCGKWHGIRGPALPFVSRQSVCRTDSSETEPPRVWG